MEPTLVREITTSFRGYVARQQGRSRAVVRASSAALPPPIYWYSTPFFRLNIGIAQVGFGEYRDAVGMLASGLEELPTDQRSAEWVREYEDMLTGAKECA